MPEQTDDPARLTDTDRERRMDAISGAALRVAEEVWSEDEPTLAEYELVERILAARAATPTGPTSDPMGGEWARLDDGPASSAQMIQWHAPQTYAAITGPTSDTAAQALRDAADEMAQSWGPCARWAEEWLRLRADRLAQAPDPDTSTATVPTTPGQVLRERIERLRDVADRWDRPGPGRSLSQRAHDKADGIELAARVLGVDLNLREAGGEGR